MKDTGSQLNPRNEEEGVHVHKTLDDQHGEDDQSEMPPFGDVVGIVESNNALENVCCHIRNASKQRNPGEPGHPTLNPGNKSSVALGC